MNNEVVFSPSCGICEIAVSCGDVTIEYYRGDEDVLVSFSQGYTASSFLVKKELILQFAEYVKEHG